MQVNQCREDQAVVLCLGIAAASNGRSGSIFRFRVPYRLGLMFLWALMLTGCGRGRERTYPVSGTVRIDGQALAGCMVMFRPEQGPMASGWLDDEGRFDLTTYRLRDGAVAGRHQVSLAPPETQFDMSDDEIEFLQDTSTLRRPPPFPAKYLSVATSDLTAEVQAGSNAFEFDLEP